MDDFKFKDVNELTEAQRDALLELILDKLKVKLAVTKNGDIFLYEWGDED